MAVTEYEAKFTCLQWFYREMRADRFFEGLIYSIKRLSSLVFTTTAEVVRPATCDERILKSQQSRKSGDQKEKSNKNVQKKAG